MKAEEILEAFLKYANLAPMSLDQSTMTTTVTPPVLSGQPLKRTSNIAPTDTGEANGNTVNVKPLTSPNKKLKTV